MGGPANYDSTLGTVVVDTPDGPKPVAVILPVNIPVLVPIKETETVEEETVSE